MSPGIADVLILDIGLPDIDGFQLAQAVRRLGFASKLVAPAGYGQESDKHRALAAGFDQLLTKPIGLGELEAAKGSVASVLQQRKTNLLSPGHDFARGQLSYARPARSPTAAAPAFDDNPGKER